jgi:hypothetical protein
LAKPLVITDASRNGCSVTASPIAEMEVMRDQKTVQNVILKGNLVAGMEDAYQSDGLAISRVIVVI